MRRCLVFVSMFVAGVSTGPAYASVFGDDFGRCLVEKASAEDQLILKRWMFTAFSADPSLKPLSNISPAQRTKVNAEAGGVYNRLLTVDCRKEAVSALKNEGPSVMGPAFGVLGRSVANGIFRSPEADAELSKLGESFDVAALKQVFAEAGVPISDK